jgi:hypothetical protein
VRCGELESLTLMKSRLTAVLISTFLAATSAFAGKVDTVLTPDSTLYSIETTAARTALALTRRNGEVRETVLVPTTTDAAFESDARLAFDGTTNTLYVLWHRSDANSDEIRLASMNADGEWSQPLLVTSGAAARRAGLQVLLSRPTVAEGAAPVTLVHAAWWSVGRSVAAEYALVAFEGGEHASTIVTSLDELANSRGNEAAGNEAEDTGSAAHPPLALARAENGIDVVFGKDRSTAVTRVQIEPRRVAGNARMWKPVGRGSHHTGPARLVTANSDPVQAFIANNRVVLYTPDAKFRFMVFENGRWSPIRMIELDAKLTSEQMLEQLRRTVEENVITSAKSQ